MFIGIEDFVINKLIVKIMNDIEEFIGSNPHDSTFYIPLTSKVQEKYLDNESSITLCGRYSDDLVEYLKYYFGYSKTNRIYVTTLEYMDNVKMKVIAIDLNKKNEEDDDNE